MQLIEISPVMPAALADFDGYQSQAVVKANQPLVAYFCAEYGLHESFPCRWVPASTSCRCACIRGMRCCRPRSKWG